MDKKYLPLLLRFLCCNLVKRYGKMTLNRGNDNESFVSINLESILLRVLNEVILLSLNKGQWRKKQEVAG